MQKITKITKPFLEILAIKTLGMQDHTQIKWHNTVACIDV